MKKYISILKWSKYFYYLIFSAVLNFIVGNMIVENHSKSYYIIAVYQFFIFTFLMVSLYQDFFETHKAGELLKIVPLSKKSINKLQHFGIISLTFLPSLVLIINLMLRHHKLCLFILPNQFIALLFFYTFKKWLGKNSFLLYCTVGASLITILMLSEMFLLT